MLFLWVFPQESVICQEKVRRCFCQASKSAASITSPYQLSRSEFLSKLRWDLFVPSQCVRIAQVHGGYTCQAGSCFSGMLVLSVPSLLIRAEASAQLLLAP